jgi:hypothetical protein
MERGEEENREGTMPRKRKGVKKYKPKYKRRR